MEEEQFNKLLQLFPVVRPRSYCADEVNTTRRIQTGLHGLSSTLQLEQVDTGSPSQETETDKGTPSPPTSLVALGDGASFWDLLKMAAEQQLSSCEAQRFCDTFKSLHEELVNKVLSLDAIERIAKKWPLPTK